MLCLLSNTMVTFKAKLKRPKMIPEKPKVVQNCSKGIKTARAAATHWFFENSVGNFLGLNISYITIQALPQCHKDTSNCLQNKVILTIPCILLLWIKKALQCVAISHWSRGFLTNEDYWNISLKAEVSLYLIGRVKVAEFQHNIDRRRYLVQL